MNLTGEKVKGVSEIKPYTGVRVRFEGPHGHYSRRTLQHKEY